MAEREREIARVVSPYFNSFCYLLVTQIDFLREWKTFRVHFNDILWQNVIRSYFVAKRASDATELKGMKMAKKFCRRQISFVHVFKLVAGVYLSALLHHKMTTNVAAALASFVRSVSLAFCSCPDKVCIIRLEQTHTSGHELWINLEPFCLCSYLFVYGMSQWLPVPINAALLLPLVEYDEHSTKTKHSPASGRYCGAYA